MTKRNSENNIEHAMTFLISKAQSWKEINCQELIPPQEFTSGKYHLKNHNGQNRRNRK